MSEKSSESLRKSKLSTIGVVALIFSFVAAGAFGIEEAIKAIIDEGILSSRQYLRPWQCLGRPAAAGHPRPFTQKLLRFPSFPPGHPGTYPSW